MSAWIINIGDEILTGRIFNWNAYWIAKRLTSVGVNVRRIICIPDDIDIITETIREGVREGVDYIFTTGGLGPTPGDVTLEGISIALGLQLELNEKALSYIKNRYTELYELGLVKDPEITKARKKMACIPSGAEVIYNDVGVAPAVIVESKKTKIIALPGVPSEAMYLLEKIIPKLMASEGLVVMEDIIDVCDESSISNILEYIRSRHPNVNIKTYPLGFGQKYMRVIAIGRSREGVENALNEFKNMLRRLP